MFAIVEVEKIVPLLKLPPVVMLDNKPEGLPDPQLSHFPPSPSELDLGQHMLGHSSHTADFNRAAAKSNGERDESCKPVMEFRNFKERFPS